MGEEEQQVRISDYDVTDGDHDGRVTEWEAGLPDAADLPPLSRILISPELASAFSISPEPHRSMTDVDRASRDTLSTLCNHSQPNLINKINEFDNFKSFSDDREDEIEYENQEMVVEGEETVDLVRDGSVSRKLRRVDSGAGEEAESTRTSKRNRLVWTPQLHKRFVEVVAHLGVKNAVPKTIMQLMNVEGLTRENVASHLQKYRLYLKRSNEGPSCSDNLFGSTPVPMSLRESGGIGNENMNARVQVPMAYPPQMVPMPYAPPPQIVPSSAASGGSGYHHGFEYHSHPYNVMMQPKDWSGNGVGSVLPYQHSMTPNRQG